MAHGKKNDREKLEGVRRSRRMGMGSGRMMRYRRKRAEEEVVAEQEEEEGEEV